MFFETIGFLTVLFSLFYASLSLVFGTWYDFAMGSNFKRLNLAILILVGLAMATLWVLLFVNLPFELVWAKP